MEISTFHELTRKNESIQNLEAKRAMLDQLAREVKTVSTETQRTMKYGDIWAKRNAQTTYPVDDFLTRQEEFYLRAENNLRDSLSVFFALHAYDGAISAPTYNAIVDELKNGMLKIDEALNIKGYVLTLFKNQQFVGTKLFDDPIRMKLWFKKHLGYEYTIFTNQLTVPPEYKGSILAEQDWCINPEDFFSKIKNQS